MISTEIERIQASNERIKTNIANAYIKAEEKGATLPDVLNSDNLSDTIESIEQTSGEWKPQPDWWDIESILDNDTEDYPYKIITLMEDIDVLTELNLMGAVKIKTSDGAEYSESTLHEWDINYDKNCSLGYKTRYVIWYFNIARTTNKLPQCSLYVIIKDFINMQINSGNRIFDDCGLVECIKFINSTINNGYIRFNACRKLKKLEGFMKSSTLTTMNTDGYGGTYFLDNNISFLQDWNDYSNLTSLNGFFRDMRGIDRINPQNFDTSQITNFNYCFANMYDLKYISSLDFLNATIVSNMFGNNAALTEIEEVSNIKISGINVGSSYAMRKETLLNFLNALYDYSTDTENKYTITLGSTNLAKLTDEELAIGQNKGWTIS